MSAPPSRDVVRLEPEGIQVNGEVVANSRTAVRDSSDRPSPTTRGDAPSQAGEFWLFSDHLSAYFGPVQKTDVIAVSRPVWPPLPKELKNVGAQYRRFTCG